jgi:hypothetical protein
LFLFQRGLAEATEPRRLADCPKTVSEAPASLFERPCVESVRIQKVSFFQRVGFLAGPSSCTTFTSFPCGFETPEVGVVVRSGARDGRSLDGERLRTKMRDHRANFPSRETFGPYLPFG